MNIVHLTSSRFFGGPERQMLGLADALRADCDTVVASFREGDRCNAFLERVARHGHRPVAIEHDMPRLDAAYRDVRRMLREVAADIVLCHGYKADLLGRRAARSLGLPAVAVSRGWTGETWKVRLYEKLDRRCLRGMDAVVCVSQAQADKVIRAGVSQNRVRVIRNAIDGSRFAGQEPRTADDLRSLFPQPPRFLVGAAGRLSPEKGFDVLLKAAAGVLREAADVGFVLFGDGPLRGALASSIKELGLEERVVLAGFRDDLDALLGQLDLMMLPSFTEGLPNVVLESFAAGVPVVATAVGGTPELIDEGLSGFLVPPGDPAALARRIQDAARMSASERRLMGSRGQARVAAEFTFEAQAEHYRRLFRSLECGALSPLCGRGARGTRAIRTESSNTPSPPGFGGGEGRGEGGERFRSLLRTSGSLDRSPPYPLPIVKVCFLIDRLSRAGTESQLLMLLRHLDRTEIEPTLVLLDGRDEESQALEPADCRVIRLGVRSLRSRAAVAAARRFVRFLRDEPIDVLQVYFPDSTWFGTACARLAGVKNVVLTRNNLGYALRPVDRWLGRLARRWSVRTLANCAACRQSLIEEGADPRTIELFENGIELERFERIAPFDERARRSPVRIGMVANLRPVKDPESFVRAAALVAARFPDAVFSIAGEGPLRKSLRSLAEELGLGRRLELPGSVNDVPRYLETLDVAVLSSRSEGLSNAILEYMAAGRPIVATAVGETPELLAHGERGLLVAPEQPEALAAAIEVLLERRLAARLGGRARADVRERFGAAQRARRYEAFCRDLVMRRSGHLGGMPTALRGHVIARQRHMPTQSRGHATLPPVTEGAGGPR